MFLLLAVIPKILILPISIKMLIQFYLFISHQCQRTRVFGCIKVLTNWVVKDGGSDVSAYNSNQKFISHVDLLFHCLNAWKMLKDAYQSYANISCMVLNGLFKIENKDLFRHEYFIHLTVVYITKSKFLWDRWKCFSKNWVIFIIYCQVFWKLKA